MENLLRYVIFGHLEASFLWQNWPSKVRWEIRTDMGRITNKSSGLTPLIPLISGPLAKAHGPLIAAVEQWFQNPFRRRSRSAYQGRWNRPPSGSLRSVFGTEKCNKLHFPPPKTAAQQRRYVYEV